ncbi:TolC family protein [Sulfurospirillum sp. T05]|uniref:TolC family protein n=1 Tax=Sulfurospirillum tamanense TaxID=2813362 RepID=A0ABS2WPH4_9BACT|nr:TolC family protein [Sulfurospirillum tamanensis]
MKRFLYLLWVPVLVWSAPLTHLRLDDALVLLQEHNPELIVSDFEAQLRALDASGVEASAWGSVDLVQTAARSNDALNVFGFKLQSREATFQDFGFADFDSTNPNVLHVKSDDLNRPKARNHFSTTIELRVPLYTGGRRAASHHIAQTFHALSRLDTQSLLAEKIQELKRSFYALSLLYDQESTLQELLKNTRALERTATAMHEEGYATATDVLEVKARLAGVSRMLQDTQANSKLLLHVLSFLLNHEVASIAPTLPALQAPSTPPEKTLDVQKATLGAQIAHLDIKRNKAAFMPTVGLLGQYAWSGKEALELSSKNDAYTVGVEFRWNLFQGGGHSIALEKARLAHLKSQHQLSLAKQGTALAFAKLHTQLAQHDHQLQSLEAELTLFKQIYEHHLGRYQENLASMSDVLIKHAELLGKILEHNAAKNKRVETLLSLEKLTHGVQP